MAHFYGSVQGNRGKVTRCGSKNSGYITEALSWEGGVAVDLYFNEEKQEDWVKVWLVTHCGRGVNEELYNGPISGTEFTNFNKEI